MTDRWHPHSRSHSGPHRAPPTIPRRIQHSGSDKANLPQDQLDIHADSSDSDFDHHTRRAPLHRPDNERHLENSLRRSSIPGSGDRRQQQHQRQPSFGTTPVDPGGLVWIDDRNIMAKDSTVRHRRGGPSGSKDFATGNCMTCASLVRWPKGLQVFKCTICMTINDLVPQKSNQQDKGGSGGNWAGLPFSASHSAADKVKPISLELSRHLVREGIRAYIYNKLCSERSRLDDGSSLTNTLPKHNDGLRPGLPNRSRGMSDGGQGQARHADENKHGSYTPQYVFDEEPTLRPNPQRPSIRSPRSYSSSHSERPPIRDASSQSAAGRHRRIPSPGHQGEAKRIFKKLEDYIVDCLSSFDCVNCSFSRSQSHSTSQQVDTTIPRKPINSDQPQLPRQLPDLPRDVRQTDNLVFDLDPKLLLLGDVAENGMWWTGIQDSISHKVSPQKREERKTKPSSSPTKSPHMNWGDLEAWYGVIINAAEGWFGIFEEFAQDPGFPQTNERDLQILERDILVAQVHTQRVLMKATETLLKRPGRRIVDPSDLHFLLILLENPLLRPETRTFQGLLQLKEADPKQSPSPVSGPLSGQHSGITKRIIGLLSNSPPHCHNQLIAWLARYHISRFGQVKGLVSSFLTYRILRQSGKKQEVAVDVTAGLIPEVQTGRSGAYLYDEIGVSSLKKPKEPQKKEVFADDWQIKAASRVLALIFAANGVSNVRRGGGKSTLAANGDALADTAPDGVHTSDQLLPASDFYNSMIDNIDLITDFEAWESKRAKFSFCQYPFLLSIWAKTRILEFDARRQMQMKARDAFFDSIMTRKTVNQYLTLDIRRDCLVDDSLKAVSEVVGSGTEDIKKGLRISFRGEEGIDGGGLRKEWFLLLVREVFNPDHGMFLYDEDSLYCYFNPSSFEPSDQFFLVGVVMGLAIYNSTILDVALPPFAFRKLLASIPAHGVGASAHKRPMMKYTLDDLAEYRPRLAQGLKQLLEHDGDVEATFCLDFVIETDKYGTKTQVPLCQGGERKPVTNQNRREYVDLYVRYLLDTAVQRQFEPFKRGFYTVCGGNAFSLFRPEEIELLVRGSDEAVDISSLRAVAEYNNWESRRPDGAEPVVGWFWESFANASHSDQRKLLSFITGSDRIPAMGAAMLPIKLSCLGDDSDRFPVARTCFNMLSLYRYETKEKLEGLLWRAVYESEGFGLK